MGSLEIKAKKAAYRLAHREEINLHMRDYRVAHLEEVRASARVRGRVYYAANREKCLTRFKDYHHKHREERKAYNKVYNITHKESRDSKNKAYYAKHREERLAKAKINRQSPEYKIWAKAYRQTPGYKLRSAAHNQTAEAKQYQRDHKLKQLYGLTPLDKKNLLEKQGGVCAICRTDKFNKLGPHVDHDHISGIIRGILCSDCNRALGALKDSVLIAMRIIDYLEISAKRIEQGRIA